MVPNHTTHLLPVPSCTDGWRTWSEVPWESAIVNQYNISNYDIMEKMIGYCGLNCADCEAHIATINNDDELRKEVSRKRCEIFHTDIITPDKINCMGCRSAGPHYFFCIGK